jgi:hypothetical protein
VQPTGPKIFASAASDSDIPISIKRAFGTSICFLQWTQSLRARRCAATRTVDEATR